MPLSIKNPETERLARQVAKETGESVTEAIQKALRERLGRLQKPNRKRLREEQMKEILQRIDAMPVLDHRSADEILGYDDHGLPS